MARVVAPISLTLATFLIGAPSASADGADVYGTGGGSINFLGGQKSIKFAFSGHTGPTRDFGSVRFTFEPPASPLEVHVDVDCVNVFSNPPGAGGWIGGKVKEVEPFPNTYGIAPGDNLVFGINDFGNPSGTIPDEFNAYYGSPQLCKNLGPTHHIPISQGNITIKLP